LFYSCSFSAESAGVALVLPQTFEPNLFHLPPPLQTATNTTMQIQVQTEATGVVVFLFLLKHYDIGE
jgi:hypothetical protein